MLRIGVDDYFEKPFAALLAVIIVYVIECIVYFVFMGVMFHISTWDEKGERKHVADITFGVSAALYSVRSVVMLIGSGFYFLRKVCAGPQHPRIVQRDGVTIIWVTQ